MHTAGSQVVPEDYLMAPIVGGATGGESDAEYSEHAARLRVVRVLLEHAARGMHHYAAFNLGLVHLYGYGTYNLSHAQKSVPQCTRNMLCAVRALCLL